MIEASRTKKLKRQLYFQHIFFEAKKINDEMKLSKEERELILMYRWMHQESKDKLMTAEVLVNLGRRNTKNKQKEKSVEWRNCQKPTLTEEIYNMDTPFFSIIIPVYKVRQEYLEICVESIRKQSFCDLEIILVDDGSPDNCGAICDGYSKMDERIKVIHQKNQGVSAARNAGIEAAKGDWVMFVDADDWVADGSYEKLAAYVCNCDYDMLMFRVVKAYENQMVAHTYPFEPNRVYDTSICEDKEALYRLAMHPKKPGNSVVYYSVDKVIRREFLNTMNLRYPVGLPKSEDKVFVLQCFEKLRNLCFIDEAYYFYRINIESVCNRYSNTADTDRLLLANILLQIAARMDTELGNLKSDKSYSALTNDCKRFLFGIISDVFSLKFFHSDCPYSKRESKALAKKFIETEPFHTCIQFVKYDQLSVSTKLKKFLLQRGWVGIYYSIYKLRLSMKNIRKQN